jgi:flagellar hook-associated protein 3 FlgL
MSTIPSNLARVPTMLSSSIMLSSLQLGQSRLLNAQVQLATGKLVNRPSDDPVASSTVTVLEDILERRTQRLRNMSHAESALGTLDEALSDASDLLLEAKGIGASQIGVGSDAQTRKNQAEVIDAMINELVNVSNRKYQLTHILGGSATASPAMSSLLGQLRYGGSGDGMITDLGFQRGVPITMSGETAFGALSARVKGDADLDPLLTTSTRLSDLHGALGTGVALGSFNVDVNGMDVVVDVTTAHTVQDVIDALQTAIQTVDAGATVTVDAASGNSLRITPSGGVTVTVSDLGSEGTAADLGLTGTYTGPGGAAGSDINPRMTATTNLADLRNITFPLGTIRLENAGQTRDLDLSGAETVEDVINAVAGLNLGIRVEIAETSDRLNFINELSGGHMSIGEVGGNTATELGVRSLAGSTLLSDFNDGEGVTIRSGSVDPITGLPDPAADIDFRVTLKDGRTFDVDLAGAQTVDDVLTAINAAATGAGVGVPAEFSAGLAGTGNGIALNDATVGTTTSVTRLNGSFAAGDLGILGTTTGATLTGEDRATVAVDSVFSHLIALRDALRGNDERGITVATGKLDGDIARVAEARATVGVRSRRVADGVDREEELQLQDLSLKSQLQDLDYTEAAVRFASLQQQLQAGLATTSQISRLSLLDYL